MFTHLLVPLDGSALAETVLPAAAGLARAFAARVTLVHVIERGAPRNVHGQRHLHDPEEAREYLDAVARDAFGSDVEVARHVHQEETSHVAASIVQHVEEFATDLIVMCAHGAGGLRGFIIGSIAQQVMSMQASPMLVSRPLSAEPGRPFRCRRVLVPLDGNPAHEQALDRALDLSRRCGAAIHLLRVVPDHRDLSGSRLVTSRLLPGTSRRLAEVETDEAEAYLREREAALTAAGAVATREVGHGEPAALIADAGRHPSIDVIVLGTHGRKGMDAFWSGSVGARLCRACETPLLLVPARPED